MLEESFILNRLKGSPEWILNTSANSSWHGICLNIPDFLSLFIPQGTKQQKQPGKDSQE